VDGAGIDPGAYSSVRVLDSERIASEIVRCTVGGPRARAVSAAPRALGVEQRSVSRLRVDEYR